MVMVKDSAVFYIGVHRSGQSSGDVDSSLDVERLTNWGGRDLLYFIRCCHNAAHEAAKILHDKYVYNLDQKTKMVDAAKQVWGEDIKLTGLGDFCPVSGRFCSSEKAAGK